MVMKNMTDICKERLSGLENAENHSPSRTVFAKKLVLFLFLKAIRTNCNIQSIIVLKWYKLLQEVKMIKVLMDEVSQYSCISFANDENGGSLP